MRRLEPIRHEEEEPVTTFTQYSWHWASSVNHAKVQAGVGVVNE
jgi:hypothetical protein